MDARSIVVATDFSDAAEHAVLFACTMAKSLNLPLTIVHAYVIPITFSETPMPLISLDETRAIAIKKTEELVARIGQQHSEIELHASVLYGEVTDALLEYEAAHAPSFFVVGNSGIGNSALWLGSNVASMMRQLKTAVIAVPQTSSFTAPKILCLACDLSEGMLRLPEEAISQLQKMTGAKLHFLHVNKDASKENENIPQRFLEISKVWPEASTQILNAENVDDAIKEFVSTNEIDWLIILPKKHSFLYNLFHKNHTEGLLKVSNIPLVALHQE